MLIGVLGQLLHAFSFAFTFALALVKSFSFAFLALLPSPFLLVAGSAVLAEVVSHTALVASSAFSSIVRIAVVRGLALAFSFTSAILGPTISALMPLLATEVALAVELLGHSSNVHR